ncbi:MAG: protein-glutamine gamma-glutamyltransferase [Clostridiaceae bacterium]|jgi:protein-glutamine gamma-glutamyltransferase|nr:protein-glutamine gamma-glutamyltransferase [Clostridiaceae bacterium]
MIELTSGEFNAQSFLDQYTSGSAEYEMLKKLNESTHTYKYPDLDELTFEIKMRRAIINASLDLYRARLSFRTFQDSKCNEDFWRRMSNGGFALKQGVKASDAINDIYRNTRQYGTECATAIVIVYYKAVLEVYGASLFDKAFTDIVLMNWQQMDELLSIATYRKLPDYIPGDCRYFRNPDVNPLTPEWQGENAIDMGNGKYYGHGIGISDANRIIAVLNQNRVADSTISAYLMDTATRPDFGSLYMYWKNS